MKNFEGFVHEIYVFAQKHDKKASKQELMIWLREHEKETIDFLFENFLKTSRRTKMLAYAIAVGYSVNETNDLLLKYRREKLYIRNVSDAVIMRTLDKGYSVFEMGKLVDSLLPLVNEIPRESAINDSELTISSMRAYLDKWNDHLDNPEDTLELTNELLDEYDKISELDDSEFYSFIIDNLQMFSTVRERTRREFVHYLYDYCNYIARTGSYGDKLALFKNINGKEVENTKKNREKYGIPEAEAEKTKKLTIKLPPESWPINIRTLGYDINEFYQGGMYAVEEARYEKKDHQDFEPYASKEEKNRWLEKNVSTEDEKSDIERIRYDTVIRSFLQGKSDIGRTLFLSNAVFLDLKVHGRISVQRLNDSLYKCGWAEIDFSGDHPLDKLVVDMLDFFNEKQFKYRDFIYIVLEDLEDPVFAEYHETYQDLQGSKTIDEATSQTMRPKERTP